MDIQRHEVMYEAGSLEKEIAECREMNSNTADTKIFVTPNFSALLTIICC